MRRLGIDIGGANIKLSDGVAFARSYPYSLWKHPRSLGSDLRSMIDESPPSDGLAITMTGELADCFETKADGVRFILDAVAHSADGRQTRVYTLDGELVTTHAASEHPLRVAASNWHALASVAARFVPQTTGLLVDIGSTTCDIIQLEEGKSVPEAYDDTGRLLNGELLYTGVQRSPLCAMVDHVPYRGKSCPVALEWFATAFDVYLILGDLPEDPDNVETADGRPATCTAARDRLARTICADRVNFHQRDAIDLAEAVAQVQLERVVDAIRTVTGRMAEPPQKIVVSGQGEFLARRAIEPLDFQAEVVSLSEKWGSTISRCAPAHALAILANEACWS